MFVPLMTDQLVPPTEPLIAVPVTAHMEAMKWTYAGEVLSEMTREVGVTAEILIAGMIGAEEER